MSSVLSESTFTMKPQPTLGLKLAFGQRVRFARIAAA